ncbi:MAG: ankyrin repeat domain-containing protein [Planctomycetaceae bacterium]|nr:ankyrin repeat domain-containing protein [Planctomycetaceae bacterium]
MNTPTQPFEMKTKAYIYGVDILDGDDAWALFDASAKGDVASVLSLLKKDRRLVNAQYWYQFPLHRAIEAGHVEVVRILLEHGADPGQSRYTYDSWHKLLLNAQQLAHREIELLLRSSMEQRFHYHPDFECIKNAIISRDATAIQQVLEQQPHLITASDALGNNAIHWFVITRQLEWIQRFASAGTPLDALRADGHSPILLAASGATDYWYREGRSRSHPTLRNTSVLVGYLLGLGAKYTASVAASIGDQERLEQWIKMDRGSVLGLDTARVSPLSRAAAAGYAHIVKLLLDQGANPNLPEECAPEGRALWEACSANHIEVAKLLLEKGANPNAGVDSCECCLTIAEVYHGDQAKPLQELLRSYGAYWPPYRMDKEQLKQAIRDNSPVVRHDEFLRSTMQHCDAELLELLLNLDSSLLERLATGDDVTQIKDPALLQILIERGLDPTMCNYRGQTLAEVFQENGNGTLEQVLTGFRQ